MAITLPVIGDMYPASPSVSKSKRITVGYSSDNDIVITSTGTYNLFYVEQPMIITSLRARVNTGFTATMTMTVGDSDDVDGWFTDTDLAPSDSDGDGLWNIGGGAYGDGRSYAAAQYITAITGTAAAAAGQMDMIITYVELSS